MTIFDLQNAMQNCMAVNIQRHGSEWRVNVRRNKSDGFQVAQRGHTTLEDALLEHFEIDDEDLLV